MRRNTADWAYLVDETGHGWLNIPESRKKREFLLRQDHVPTKAIYGIPTYHLVTATKWVSTKDQALISEMIETGSEQALGVDSEGGTGKLVDWQEIGQNGTRTLVQSVAIPWDLPETEDGRISWTEFMPQYEMFQPPAGCNRLVEREQSLDGRVFQRDQVDIRPEHW